MHRGSGKRLEVRRGVRVDRREIINVRSEFTDDITCKKHSSRDVNEISRNIYGDCD